MSLHEQRQAAIKAARAIIDGAKNDGRELTDDERGNVEQKMADVKVLDEQLRGKALVDSVLKLGTVEDEPNDDAPVSAKSLGEHFAKSVGEQGVARLKAGNATVSTPEFKAATDVQMTTGSGLVPWLTEVDKTILPVYRPRPTVADLLSSGTLGPNSNAITYFIEGAFEGAFATVAEGAQKPQIHVADPTSVTDALKKIAAWWDTSDEMIEDLAFMVSEINNRGVYMLAMFEEAQLLNGNGSGTNVRGLLQRSGIQTEVQGATGDSKQDTLFRASTKVMTATGLSADAIVINPLDYQELRLSQDANGQYFGGGFFTGQYGQGGIMQNPPIWGLNTVVTQAVPVGTAVVGALKQAATVYRKGGVRVESTNSDLGKFTSNIVTTRIEERVALAVRVPLAVVKVTFAA